MVRKGISKSLNWGGCVDVELLMTNGWELRVGLDVVVAN